MPSKIPVEISVAMTAAIHDELMAHLYQHAGLQEDVTFVAWRPSRGHRRLTAILNRVIKPASDERILHGNVAFTSEYLVRALMSLQPGEGLALVHSHFGPGWQDMSQDDVVAERDRLAGAVFGRTDLPVIGLTSGTDGAWSARAWIRVRSKLYRRIWATNVRVIGSGIQWTFHPTLCPAPRSHDSQVATVSVWGDTAQADLARCRVGIVGLGSVGSLVCEALARIGVRKLTLVDHDVIEVRNLDRTAGSLVKDVGKAKVEVAARHARTTATASDFKATPRAVRVNTRAGLEQILDCDVLFCCVDRPWPRHLLNAVAYAHLIPTVDGGILASIADGRLVHADWRIHTVGPGRACMVCVGGLDPNDVALDMAGKLDDPDYIRNLAPERAAVVSRRNVYPFSMSVAAHEVIQAVAVITSTPRLGGTAPQFYHCYPGVMECLDIRSCSDDCAYKLLTSSAADVKGNLLD
jgi:molybdopterin-synthase adenylyltransferase